MRLFWAAPSGLDPVTNLEVDSEADGRWSVIPWDGTGLSIPSPADGTQDTPVAPVEDVWAIINSQTCDIAAAGPGARHMTVQVNPLICLTGTMNNGAIAEAKRGMHVHYVWVPEVPAEGDWFADLRISLPVSKALLIAQAETRVHGFASEREALEFGERVAAKLRRPALHDELSAGLVSGLRKLVEDSQAAGDDWPDSIEQFRIAVTKGEKLDPAVIVLWAITVTDDMPTLQKQALRAWHRKEKRRLARAVDGLLLRPIVFTSADKMSARLYRDSDPLWVPELGSGAFW